MSTLAEIEKATDTLSVDELRVLFGHVAARLEKEESRVAGGATEQLMRTLGDLSRPMGGKGWVSRDELHER